MTTMITTLGLANQRKLRKAFKFRNINEAIEEYGFSQMKNKKYTEAMKKRAYEIMRDEYNRIAEEIQEQKRRQKLEQAKLKKIEKMNARANEIKMKKIMLKNQINVLKPTYEVVAGKKQKTITMSSLRKKLEQYKGQQIVAEYLINTSNKSSDYSNSNPVIVGGKQVVVSYEYNIPTNFSSWWKSHSSNWWVNSGRTIFQEHRHNGAVYFYQQNIGITTRTVTQLFRDGITHCVFTPIRNWAEEKFINSESKQTKSRYNIILKSIDELEEKYIAGVPENAISEICNRLQIDISIDLPFSENKFLDGQSIKKRLKHFKFMNSRLHHIELNEITNTDSYTEISRKELLKMKNDLDEAGTFYTFKKDLQNVSSITTLSGQFKLKNEMSEIISKFEIETGLNFCKIDDIDDYELSQFINEGTNYNATIDFEECYNTDDIKHIDMKKAYANFKTCEYYKGFLGKITDFRQTTKMNGVGLYKITNLNFKNAKGEFDQYNTKLKIYINNNVYTSAELEMLTGYGVSYDIVCGCWGVKALDFEFTEAMMGEDENGSKIYAKWTGICDSHQLEKKFWIKCDQQFFNIIKENCGNSIGEKPIGRWYENGEGCICFPKKHNYHLGHITAFITAYQRINVIQQFMEINYENIIRICVDGIYHRQNDVILKNVFRYKDEINFGNVAGDSFVDKAQEKELVINGSIEREHFAKELHIGEGGCGKTHYNCNDKGLQRVLFLAPSWKLAVCKKKETEINSSVWARALTTDPEKITFIKEKANVLIVDEVSMLSEYQKEQFFRDFSDMKIIMCGDLGFQLPCVEGEEMKPTGFDKIVKHTNDYRCNDERLKEIKVSLRQMIENKRNKNEINSWVENEFKKLGRCITVDELKEKNSIEDMILSGTNEIKDFYTSLFVGKFEKEKYYITENNRLYCNGEIMIGDKPENTKSEIRYCFTTHSIQGETAYHKLFIDSSKMFDSRMFYTAISRAKSLDQIYIIINEEQKYTYEYGKIYKIVSKNGVYIGSTIQNLDKRFKEHKQSFENYKNGKGKYMTSFKILNDDDVKIVKIENFKCNDLKELWKREAEIIKSCDCINKTFKEEEKGKIIV